MTTSKRGNFMSYEFADRLIEMRRAKNMSQEELAAALGLSRQAVSKWERAESAPDIGNLVALAKLYDVTLDELVHGNAAGDTEAETIAETATEAEWETQAEAEGADEDAKAVSATQNDAPDMQLEPESATVECIEAVTESEAHISCTQAPSEAATSTGNPAPQMPPAPAAPEPPYPFDASRPQSTPIQQVPMPQVPIQAAGASKPRTSKAWQIFPYPLLCVIIFLFCGFFFNLWHPAWIVFITIPFYYWVVIIITHDPAYVAAHSTTPSNPIQTEVHHD